MIRTKTVRSGCGQQIYIIKDLIHSDYVFKAEQISSLFQTNYKFVKVGWGDRKIFLETKTWNNLKFIDFIKAFFGFNPTVLRVEYINDMPQNYKKIQLSQKQLDIVIQHIKRSYYGDVIKKEKSYYEKGDYYKSNLKYSCITTCNN